MEQVYDLRARIKIAKDDKQWEEVIKLSNVLISRYKKYAEKWDYYWYAKALYEKEEFSKAIDVVYLTLQKFPDFNPIYKILFKVISGIVNNEKQDSYKVYDFVEILTNIKVDLDLRTEAYIDILKRLIYLNAYVLAKEALQYENHFTFSTTPREIKGRKLHSIFESFLITKVKILLGNNLYKETIDLIEFYEKERLNKNIEKWLKYYKAKAYVSIEQPQEALEILFRLLSKWREWIFAYEIGEVLSKQQKHQPALFFTVSSIIDYPQDYWYKLSALKLVAQLLKELGAEQKAKKIAKYVVDLYISKGYGQSRKVDKLVKSFGIEIEMRFDLKKEESEIKKILHNLKYSPRYKGIVKKAESNFGFIASEGKMLYFNIRQWKSDKKLLSVGAAVEFSIGWGYDFKKRRLSREAIEIKCVGEKSG